MMNQHKEMTCFSTPTLLYLGETNLCARSAQIAEIAARPGHRTSHCFEGQRERNLAQWMDRTRACLLIHSSKSVRELQLFDFSDLPRRNRCFHCFKPDKSKNTSLLSDNNHQSRKAARVDCSKNICQKLFLKFAILL